MPGFELIGQDEFLEIKEVFDKSGILFRHSFDNLRNGVYKVRDFERSFSKKMNVPYSLAVTSGTAALRVALAALDIKNGDEVITQSFTFVATVEAIIEAQATPIISEIDDTLNMDPDDLTKKITSKTKAIIVVHMLGTPARLKTIKDIADKFNIPIIEDTAWGCGGKYDNVPLGTYGEIGTFSFDFAKTMTTGEGGMVVFKDEQLYKKAAAWHDHGHENNPALPRWEDSRSSSGFNYRMMELQGAVGLAQLKKLDTVVNTQRENALEIISKIESLPIKLRTSPGNCFETCDAIVFYVKDKETAFNCRKALIKEGLGTKILPEAVTWHFAGTWNHMEELVKTYGADISKQFPKSVSFLEKSVALPVMVNMDTNYPELIYSSLQKVFE